MTDTLTIAADEADAPEAAAPETPASAEFDFVAGRFNLSDKYAIPFFSTTMSVREAAESLQLVTDLPGSENLAWRLDELYQRDIDWARVESEIGPYLSSSDTPQFFNSLTVALLPLRDGETQDSFAGPGWAAPPLLGKNFKKTLTVGPITVGYYSVWSQPEELGSRIGHIRWNREQVFSVAIDGQHRLAALKDLAKATGPRVDSTRVPVILLVLDPRLGFRAPKERRLVELMRGLFIDLNKHAEVVSRPRQILLDDKDPHSLCVRALVGDRITESLDDIEPNQLHLSLVDWHSEQAKFESGPYLTTILGLDWIVEKALGSRPLKDYAAYGPVRKQLRALSIQLGLDFHKPGSDTFKRYTEISTAAVEPFSYTGAWSHSKSEGELGAIVDAFRATWAEGLVTVLTQFSPYAELIALRRKSPPSSLELVNWYYLLQRRGSGDRAGQEYANLLARLRNRKDKPISKVTLETRLAEIDAHKNDNLAFKVAFQRALVIAFLDFVELDGDDLPEVDFGDDEVDENSDDSEDMNVQENTGGSTARGAVTVERAKQFVSVLNRVVERAPEFLSVRGTIAGTDDHIWAGSLYDKAADAIDFTLGASRRARDLVFVTAALGLCSERNDAALQAGFEEFWDGFQDSDVGIHQKLQRALLKRYSDRQGAGGRIVSERGEYSQPEAIAEAKKRLEWIWEVLGLPPSTKKKGKKRVR